jgi:hypothetical protein
VTGVTFSAGKAEFAPHLFGTTEVMPFPLGLAAPSNKTLASIRYNDYI